MKAGIRTGMIRALVPVQRLDGSVLWEWRDVPGLEFRLSSVELCSGDSLTVTYILAPGGPAALTDPAADR